MTSDAKIGLLLGLIFIFVIAFIINGLPSIGGQANSSELPQNSAEYDEQPPGVAASTRRANNNILTYEQFAGSYESESPQRPQPNSNSSSSQPNSAGNNSSSRDQQGRGFGGGRGGFGGPGQGGFAGSGQGTGPGNFGMGQMPGRSGGMPNPTQSANNTSETQNQMSPAGSNPPNRMGGFGGYDNRSQATEAAQGGQPQRPGFNIPGQSSDQSPRSSISMPGAGQGGLGQNNLPQRPTVENEAANETVRQIVGSGNARFNNGLQTGAQQIYVVVDGDNLTKIAKKFYGDAEGVKPSNIKRIFEANRDILSSPDRLSIGQKLRIPALSDNATSTAGNMFMQTPPSGAGQRRNNVANTGRNNIVWYEVVDGDSLWKIAANKLGSGVRYEEIAAMNTDILSNENSLMPGMRLRLPVQ